MTTEKERRRRDLRCPECGAPVLRILWGFPMGDPGPDEVLGGCDVVEWPPPGWRCRVCSWEGDLADEPARS